MSKEEMENVVIHLTFGLNYKLKLKENIIYLSFQHLEPSLWCCKLVVIEDLSKFMSFLLKNRTTDWNAVTTQMQTTLARLHLTFRMFHFSLFVVSVRNFEKLQRIFVVVFLPISKSATRNTELVRNIFIRSTLFKFFWWFVLYFQSHFMMLPFCGHFYQVSHQQLNSNRFKDFKSFEYYGTRIETFELTTVENDRIRNKNSYCIMKNTSRGPKNLFDLDGFSNYVSSN